jgi:hypothetical protein
MAALPMARHLLLERVIAVDERLPELKTERLLRVSPPAGGDGANRNRVCRHKQMIWQAAFSPTLKDREGISGILCLAEGKHASQLKATE